MSYETQYKFVSSCGERKEEIESYSKDDTSYYDDWCNDIKSQYTRYNNFNDRFTCRKIMEYLYFINLKDAPIYNDNRCTYLYYWIYYVLLEKKTNYDEALQLYRRLLSLYFSRIHDPHICNNYENESKNIILEKSAKLTELYDTINNNSKEFNCECAIKCSKLYIEYLKECDKNYDHDYCRELENFKLKYEEKMKSINACEGAQKILPSAIKNYLHFVIIIPIIILTILSFLVFALYKFTPIGSRITLRKRRKNVFFENQFDRTNTLLPTSGRTRRTEQNIAYNIAYNSTKYS